MRLSRKTSFRGGHHSFHLSTFATSPERTTLNGSLPSTVDLTLPGAHKLLTQQKTDEKHLSFRINTIEEVCFFPFNIDETNIVTLRVKQNVSTCDCFFHPCARSRVIVM